MVNDINYLIEKNNKLTSDNADLMARLKEANEIIGSIRAGNIDAVLSTHDKVSTVLVPADADQTYRMFIENMSQGVVTLLMDGIILFSNASFSRIMHRSVKKLIGTNFRNLIPADQREKFEVFFSSQPSKNITIEYSVKNKLDVPAYYIITLNKLKLEEFDALNLVWTDITDQKIAADKLKIVNISLQREILQRLLSEKEVVVLNNRLKENIRTLEDANIEIKTFAHIASHDLQEPLRKIILYSSLLKNDFQNSIDEKGQGYISKMQKASQRMRNLINDILEYSELSQKHIVFKKITLQAVLNDVIFSLEPVIHKTGAKIIINKTLPEIDANPGQMRKLFQNLISNSIKFSKAGQYPEIVISYKIKKGRDIGVTADNMFEEDFYVLYVKDNGIGFDPEYNRQIFTIFQRLNNNAHYTGTGIGLAICKKIVEQHNGYVYANGMLNEGSLFTVMLPVSQAHPVSEP